MLRCLLCASLRLLRLLLFLFFFITFVCPLPFACLDCRRSGVPAMAMTENGQLYLPGPLALNDLLGLGKNLSGGNQRENPASKTCNRAVSINYQKKENAQANFSALR